MTSLCWGGMVGGVSFFDFLPFTRYKKKRAKRNGVFNAWHEIDPFKTYPLRLRTYGSSLAL